MGLQLPVLVLELGYFLLELLSFPCTPFNVTLAVGLLPDLGCGFLLPLHFLLWLWLELFFLLTHLTLRLLLRRVYIDDACSLPLLSYCCFLRELLHSNRAFWLFLPLECADSLLLSLSDELYHILELLAQNGLQAQQCGPGHLILSQRNWLGAQLCLQSL